MDTKTLIAVVLMVFVWMYFVNPSPKAPVATNTISTSATTNPQKTVTENSAALQTKSVESALAQKDLGLENNLINVQLNALGTIKSVTFKKFGSHSGERENLKLDFSKDAFNKSDIFLSSGPIDWKLVQSTPTKILLEGMSQGVKVQREISLKDGDYFLTVKNEVANNSKALLKTSAKIEIQRTAPTPQKPLGFMDQIFPKNEEPEQVIASTDGSLFKKVIGHLGGPVEKTAVAWAGIGQKYFLAGVVPVNVGIRKLNLSEPSADKINEEIYLSEKEISPGDSSNYSYNVYLGPKDLKELAKAGPDLTTAVEYGDWLGPISRLLLNILHFFYGLIPNYGVAIILLTILVKIALFPLAFKAAVSMRKLQLVTPKMKEIRERYKDDKYRMNAEVMALYKTEKVNPIGGCLPILIQMPVFFALYRVFSVSIELRHAPFFGWIQDLSAHDHFFVTPILMTLSMWYQQKLTPAPAVDDDNEAAKMQRAMLKWMPIFFGAIMIFLPSGLTLYMLVNALISIIQQIWLNKHLSLKFPLSNATQSKALP